MDIGQVAKKHALTPEDRTLLSRLLDTALRAAQSGICRYSPFLSPAERALLLRVTELNAVVELGFEGGYPEAERTLAVFMPRGTEIQGPAPLSVLAIEYKGSPLSHRDILGSVLGLGIKREKVGDILVGDGPPLLICDSVIAPYICDHLERAGRNRVHAAPAQLGDIPPPRFESKTFSVQSPRLDAVVSGAFGISRPDAAGAIRRGDVTLNWQQAISLSKEVCEDDRIAFRGHGKIRVARIGGQSRKGRTFVEIHKYV